MKIFRWFIAVAIILFIPMYSLAWGKLGHRVIGRIAEHYLSAKAKSEIRKLLGNEPFALAGDWADFIRSDHAYDYLDPWHYINLPSGMSEKELNGYLQKDTSTNVYTKLTMLTRELKSNKLSKEKKTFYLKLIIHFAGDIHQPLHTGRREDRGGNSIKLYWFNVPTNLHRVWDEQMVEFQQLSFTEHAAAINFTTPAQIQKWQRQPLWQWIHESYQVADKLYSGVKPEERLGYQYNFLNVKIMNQQLLKGGVRLAGLLNDIFAKKSLS